MNVFPSRDLHFTARWNLVNSTCKVSEHSDLDFRVMHNAIFTNKKLMRIGKID